MRDVLRYSVWQCREVRLECWWAGDAERDRNFFVVFNTFFFSKITTEVSNWTEEDQATSGACEYSLI